MFGGFVVSVASLLRQLELVTIVKFIYPSASFVLHLECAIEVFDQFATFRVKASELLFPL